MVAPALGLRYRASAMCLAGSSRGIGQRGPSGNGCAHALEWTSDLAWMCRSEKAPLPSSHYTDFGSLARWADVAKSSLGGWIGLRTCPGVGSMALFNGIQLIHRELADPIDLSTRPHDLQFVDDFGFPKAEVKA